MQKKTHKKYILFIVLFFICPVCRAQIYKYIGVENGLSNRQVYSIQKDKKGYMWFLTHDGIDRFDGKLFRHYKLTVNGKDINSFATTNQLYVDSSGDIWEIGKDGQFFRYNHLYDHFEFIGALNTTDNKNILTYAYIDKNDNIWCGTASGVNYIYNIKNNSTHVLNKLCEDPINSIVQVSSHTYYIGTNKKIFGIRLQGNKIHKIPKIEIDSLKLHVNTLYYHESTQQLYIGCFLNGIYIYDLKHQRIMHPQTGLTDIGINSIKPLNDKEILIATDGAGVYKINSKSLLCAPCIISNYTEPNEMDGNNINDLYIDEEQRIWMANYPIGITVRNPRYPKYKWIKHSFGNKNSLINDQVNAVLEDSDGDLWFATNNGISLYQPTRDQWTNLLSSFHSDSHNQNHVFLTICEIAPGKFMIGGYASGLYLIDKTNMRPYYFIPAEHKNSMHADKYIRAIYKDSEGYIWSGGYYNLKCLDIHHKKFEVYPGLHSINYITEKDSSHLWIGTSNGLYLLNKHTKKFCPIKLPVEFSYINVIYQDKKGMVYIGTSGSGLIIYNHQNHNTDVYAKENSALISNSIYSILPDGKGNLILSTENSLSRFNIKNKYFKNWTCEQGLLTNHFNPSSGTVTDRHTVIIGSGNGAIEFDLDAQLPQKYYTQLVFSDFRLLYQPVQVGENNSPLEKDIDETASLDLGYDQNTFSLRLSSINYDYPSNILYSWKLDGFYNKWSKPGTKAIVRYTNLNPGKYTLRVRTISKEDQHILEERSLKIIIRPPFWATIWAAFIYLIIIALIAFLFLRYFLMKKERKSSTEKIKFFINTAHDLRTPLTLIKSPLESIREEEHLSERGKMNLSIATRNMNSLLKLISNLIDFEKADTLSTLNISEYELHAFIEENIHEFQNYAEHKKIELTFQCNFSYLNVWFDKHQMESILKNLLSNALKYTMEGGKVTVTATTNNKNWSIEVKDTGIGIPEKEQKRLFKLFFRGSNAINSKITGSGIGLLLVWKLVARHKGVINVKSVEHQGSTFKITFPHGNKHFRRNKILINKPVKSISDSLKPTLDNLIPPTPKITINPSAPRILVAEDNDDMVTYLKSCLSDTYMVFTASNGKEALELIKTVNPELIISDIMMPEMRGDELCVHLKNNLETSHIPIILLTALNDEKSILSGLKARADKYITKPFDFKILKANVQSLLENRAILRKKFANLEIQEQNVSYQNCTSELDYTFMAKVKVIIEENMFDPKFTVDMLASKCNMSRTAFYTKLKALTDQAPNDLIKNAKMKKAATLLKLNQYTIQEITEMVGFSDPKYFREVFKKYYGMTPTQYANNDEK